jgi:hypothetical protein
MFERGIGILFDIEALGGGFYGDHAWRLFMSTVRPDHIVGCILREGDTNATLVGSTNQFCIAVQGPSLDVDEIKKIFLARKDAGFAAASFRFITNPQLESEPLVLVGMIDSARRLVVDEWSRVIHERCHECKWGYAPRSYPKDLPESLMSELQSMMTATYESLVENPTPQRVVAGAQADKRWWQFWR